jgi:signal transduction histidine kinase
MAISGTTELWYVLAFGVAALVSFLSIARARTVADTETRRGLVGLLVGSGIWAASHAGLLVAPTRDLQVASYTFGLVFGFGTVFAWLYFCSAYTGREYHRRRKYLGVGAGLYLGVTAIKLTNPWHHLYFESSFATSPFPHLVIQQQWFHWVVTGLSYSLAAVGLFMLFEMFRDADFPTRSLAGLTGLTALPVALDIVGFSSDALVGIIYAPLGVAAFAIGVLFVCEERFMAVQLTGDVDDPIVLLDTDDRITDYNGQARQLFPDIDDAVGRPVSTLPQLEHALDSERGVLEVEIDGERRYFLVSNSAFDIGRTDIGAVLLFSEVTRLERQRRELVRHNEQLESFATGIRHELRNKLQIVGGHVDAAGSAMEDGDVTTARQSINTASETADRMERTVDDLSTLAQYGQTVQDRKTVEFGPTARRAWELTGTVDLSLSLDGEGTIMADPGRLEELFENAFTFAVHNDADTVTLELLADGFAFVDDGTRPPDDKLDELFDHGAAVPSAEAGMAMPNVRTLARVHDWTVEVDEDYRDGVRVTVTGAVVSRSDPVEMD